MTGCLVSLVLSQGRCSYTFLSSPPGKNTGVLHILGRLSRGPPESRRVPPEGLAMSNSGWDGMPLEVLVNVFQRVNGCVSRKSARSVCRQWRRGHGLSVQHLHPCTLDTDKILEEFPFATSIDLRRRTRGEHAPGLLESLAPLTGLQKLNLGSCRQATDASLTGLTSLTALHTLVLSHCWWIKGRGLVALSSLKALHSLTLSSCDIGREGLEAVAKLPSLTHLDLNFCWRLSEAGVELLATAIPLRTLAVAGSTVRDRGAEIFSGLPHLTALDMGGCEITDVGAQHLSSCKTLRSLSIQQSLVTDNGLPFLAALPDLRELNLTQCALVTGSGQGLTALATHGSLSRLHLKGCPLGIVALGIVNDLSQNSAKEVIR
eukprot:CAMPEP_0117657026 /NCGR_PEP_ID=MMETSP0804-20121206/5114_1 /TAXON_ID=1074897 /ORGANISM="Tetraselmis astigmatica, Strain CCMP880" /LENGTH=374 /DNA_ID=CAMNT_0005463459 /DNA_START=528 /DNA_END=1652 /DNA_ORIENTATION=+